jgi:hypothetical protein
MSAGAAIKNYKKLSKEIFKPIIFRFVGGDVLKAIFNRLWY